MVPKRSSRANSSVWAALRRAGPQGEDNPGAIVLAHLQHPVPDPRVLVPTLPEKVAKAIMRALAKEPDERHPTAGALVEAVG